MAAGPIKFEIVLDSADSTFSPGEIVTGRVIIELGRTETIRGLKLRFTGKGQVRWNGGSSSGNMRNSRSYIANEEYFRSEIYLLGQVGFNERIEIEAGSYVYPFNFVLPYNIPSSFEHKHGYVRYVIKAIIDRPWNFDHHTSMLITIETPYYLSQDPAAEIPIEDEEQHTFCFLSCFNVGSLSLKICIPTSAFAIGETIEAKIFLNNTSKNVDVTNIKLQLLQKVTLRAGKRTKRNFEIVENAEKGGLFDKKDEIVISMQVPALPPSNFPYCRIIDIEYHLAVDITVTGCHWNINRSYPITIGTRTALSFQSTQGPYLIPVPIQNSDLSATFCPNVCRTPVPSNSSYCIAATDRRQMSHCSTASASQYATTSNAPIGFFCLIPGQTSASSAENPPPSYNMCMNMKM